MESSALLKTCGCKGIRTCLLCENIEPERPNGSEIPAVQKYYYCPECCKAWETSALSSHPSHAGASLDFPGICLVQDFITGDQELELVCTIDQTAWTDSQSGRKKQDYGPKVNFKKRKLRPGGFSGLPSFSECLYKDMCSIPVLEGFLPVELCNLDYSPDRGAAIDPHFDDFWVWGDRLVTINLLSDTYLTMSRDDDPGLEVLVPMPRRSLIVVYGQARTVWKHAIKRQDITGRRLAITFRELTPEFLEGGDNEKVGTDLLDIALTFQGQAIGTS